MDKLGDNPEQNNFTTSSRALKNWVKGNHTKSNAIEIPSINLPKGGGAIKGIDEKFSVNAVNGTASLSIPLPFSSARGASPKISLLYNSGNGNGIFGLGWNINLPSIKRKTDKQLPQYFDSVDSDTFLFSEAEDLVPEFKKEFKTKSDGTIEVDSDGNKIEVFSIDSNGDYIIKENTSPDGNFTVRFYKPRIEGLFAHIERWLKNDGSEIKWRIITKDNITMLFGWSAQSRLSAPKKPEKIYEWLPEFIFDDKGNCTKYLYKFEDETGIDTSLAHNKNRIESNAITYTNLYPDKILYGNKTPYKKFGDVFPADNDFLFETVFDYGTLKVNDAPDKINEWDFRTDAFSEYKPGFEIRTTRLCKRILFFHHFKDEEYNGLVRSLNFEYDTSAEQDFTFLKFITSLGYIRLPDGSYSSKKLPPLEFKYQEHEWNNDIITVSRDALIHSPVGFEEPPYQFVDLFSEGLSGILSEYATGWYYKHNLGKRLIENGTDEELIFEEAKLISSKPSFSGLGSQLHLVDLNADGSKQLVSYSTEPKGFFDLNDDNDWLSYNDFKQLPNIDFKDPFLRMFDLNGDGKTELVISEDNVFTWYESQGRTGYKDAKKTLKPFDEETGPYIVFADENQTIFLADMSGDGLTDIVRIRNSEVCYWPNLGYGNFGTKVTMDSPPIFDNYDEFNPVNIKLADIDGSGTTDIIYLGKNKFSCWKNLSGNRFSAVPYEIIPFPEIHSAAKVTVTDLLGNGVACIVWSSPLAKDAEAPLKYIDLMNGKKPHIMVKYLNSLGKEVSLEYTPSTKFYIDDKLNGNPWITKLHFPVHCVSKTITEDKITGHKFITSYKYHNGYYDHPEREFRGFGMVEQTDSESFEHWIKSGASNITDADLYQEPVITKQWFHTGAFLRNEKILSQFAHEYWYEEMSRNGFPVVHHEKSLDDAFIIPAKVIPQTVMDHLGTEEYLQALRACKGMALRSEVFARDAAKFGNTADARKKELIPYNVTAHNCIIELLQPKGKNKYAVFLVKESESLTYNYERTTEDPRITHSLNIKLDEYGNILESASIVYPRKINDASLPPETQDAQNKTIIIYTLDKYTNDVFDNDTNRQRLIAETQTYELKGVIKTGDYYSLKDFENILSGTKTTEALYYELNKPLTAGKAQRRLIEHVKTLYYKNNLTSSLPLYSLESKAVQYENYQLAYTPGLLSDIFGPINVPGAKITDSLLNNEGKFTHSKDENNIDDSNWWIRSGTAQYIEGTETAIDASNRFYVPVSYTEPFGGKTKVKYYSAYFLLIQEIEDAKGNILKVDISPPHSGFNFRTLTPRRMIDINGNISEVLTDEIGLVKATAVFGKGNQADDLAAIKEETDSAETALVQSFFNPPVTAQGVTDSGSLINFGLQLIQNATARFVYDFDVYTNTGKPAAAASIRRETHFRDSKGNPNPPSRLQLSFEYSSGSGKVAMKKIQAEPGPAKRVELLPNNFITVDDVDTGLLLRWTGSGKTILNNKGNPVKQYEPYFSINNQYENYKELVEAGVTPLMYYDPPGRLIRTDMPNGSFSKIEFDSWKQIISDQNDTVIESDWYKKRSDNTRPDFITDVKEQQAAVKTALHAETPNQLHMDTLGRPVLSVEHNKDITTYADEFYFTTVDLDIEGNMRSVTDARGNIVMQYKYDMLGNKVYQKSMDAGQRWLLTNILGNPLRTWDERNHEFQYFYDELHRPLQRKIIGGDGINPLDNIFERFFYGESLLTGIRTDTNRFNEAALQSKNVLGKVIRLFDTGGLIDTPEYDFKGKPVSTTRILFKKYKETADWIDANLNIDLEPDTFTFITETDALGRISKQTSPDSSITTPSYNEAGLLESESVEHFNPAATTVYIKNIDYNEKGQRNSITYGNDVTTDFHYDEETFRLIHIESRKKDSTLLQDLYYTYDPVGNLTHIEDKSIPSTFFDNFKVEPASTYTYDAIYRLIESAGRENNSELNFGDCDNWNDNPFIHSVIPGDPTAMRNYTEKYKYDNVGNILEMKHIASKQWTRKYEYESDNNRLKSTHIGDNGTPADYIKYTHHPKHGFLTEMPHLEKIAWNFKEEVVLTSRQHCTGDNIPVTTYYQYDGQGERIRKITENFSANNNPTKKEERIYILGYEIYKKYTGSNSGLERASLSLMDKKHRFVIIETRNNIDDGTDKRVVRFQLHNHLGSSSLELNSIANVISYEEYHSYGTTAYQAKNKSIKAAAKRYRYTGLERDDETGLEYHSARYYIPWLGRWLNCDPLGIKDGLNIYTYSHNNPIRFLDLFGTECNERDRSTCPEGTPPPPPVTTGTLLPSADANGGGPPRDPPPPALTGRDRNPYQLTLDVLDAWSESSRQFQLRGGLLSPQYRASSYPVTGSNQILPSLGRAFKLTLDEHPQLQADLKHFGLGIWNNYQVPILTFGGFGLLGVATAAGAGNEWGPASKVLGFLPTLVPEQTVSLSQGPSSPGDLYFRQFAFSLRDSTTIGRNEGNNALGIFPTFQFRGQYLDHDITFTGGVNTRYLPDLRQFRLQESFGIDYNLLRFNIGDYRASFGTEGRLNLYQQINLSEPTGSTSYRNEGSFMFQFRITEPPARNSSRRLEDTP